MWQYNNSENEMLYFTLHPHQSAERYYCYDNTLEVDTHPTQE
jgi:hypothetical protein